MTQDLQQARIQGRRPRPRHLQEIDIDATEALKPVAMWLSANEHLWCPAQQRGLEIVPKEKVNRDTIKAFWQKAKADLFEDEVREVEVMVAEHRSLCLRNQRAGLSADLKRKRQWPFLKETCTSSLLTCRISITSPPQPG